MSECFYNGDDESLKAFNELLSQYKSREEESSYEVLGLAYDLFVALRNLAKNHNAMKNEILSILGLKGGIK